ncbi:AAA family ATPase [Chlorogloeopsis sp. ULAP01]|uniref:AAA family ATPase n=1 Tax=Chlorogloeopsis sp. ULAP01 TaxID=3056483 RepID=UPI0025AB47C0|nr:AAA family ATPase [Chlorogloeopsis sp. ULAP01]MDM9382606.1 AAA family ATPase [Chlorogloeopsis sp. ULAP01]
MLSSPGGYRFFALVTTVIVLAATNRSEVLDPALLRLARFNRQVLAIAGNCRGEKQFSKFILRK